MMQTGGGRYGGIHGAHMGPGVQVRHAPADTKRQTIPWVEYRNTGTGAARTCVASDAKPGSIASMPVFEMQCVDDAIGTGQLPTGLQFIKKVGVDLV